MSDQCPDEWESEDLPFINYNEFSVFPELTNRDIDNDKQAQDLNEFHWRPVSNIEDKPIDLLEIAKRNRGR